MICGKAGGGNLVEQRQEGLIVMAINHCDLRVFMERSGSGKPAKTAT
jgi:hypothetical protein